MVKHIWHWFVFFFKKKGGAVAAVAVVGGVGVCTWIKYFAVLPFKLLAAKSCVSSVRTCWIQGHGGALRGRSGLYVRTHG